MTKAAYFDLDGTLVGTSLIQPTAYYLLNQASPLKHCSDSDAPSLMLQEWQWQKCKTDAPSMKSCSLTSEE